MFLPSPSTILVAAALSALGAAAPAQATAPFWSTFFGGGARDEVVVVCRGPGNLITLVGETASTDLLVTANALQAANAGLHDAFVARIDPSLPPAQQLLWCTYLGGSDLELVFDAAVDPQNGITTVVGLSRSADFPAPTGLTAPALNGASDGFVAQIDPTGSLLLGSMFVGGSGDDRVCEVELDATGLSPLVAGVTESTDLPWTAGTFGPSHHGGLTDAFVAQVQPLLRQGSWATYVGGSWNEGSSFASYPGPGTVWPGNFDRMGLALDDAGRPVLVTTSFSPDAWTSPTALQPTHGGASDNYLVVVNPPATAAPVYATYFGGAGEERPKTLVRHPLGGFVAGGLTFSTAFPTTQGCVEGTFQGGSYGLSCDAFVTWLDPSLAGAGGLRYSTYLGGNGGEDNVLAIAVQSSGHITVAGYTAGGVSTTPRSLQPTVGPTQLTGLVARLRPGSQGSADLLHATYVGGTASGTITLCTSLVLDEVGDAFVAGATTTSSFPQQLPIPGTARVGREGFAMHLPLLPGGVFRDGLAFAVPGCAAPLHTGAGGAPLPGSTFLITATNAPPSSLGILVLGTSTTPSPLPSPYAASLLVSTIAVPLVTADAAGAAAHPLAIPPGYTIGASWGLAAQWLFLTNAACPGTGLVASSERLNF